MPPVGTDDADDVVVPPALAGLYLYSVVAPPLAEPGAEAAVAGDQKLKLPPAFRLSLVEPVPESARL